MSDAGGARRAEKPDERALAGRLGSSVAHWDALVAWLVDDVGARAEWCWGGSKSGWELRLKRGGRPLTTLTPGQGGFQALVVLGREEADRASGLRLGERARRTLEDAHPYHDGRWLFLSVACADDVEDVTALIVEKLPASLRAVHRSKARVASA